MQLTMVVSSIEHIHIRQTAKIVRLTKLDLLEVMPDNQKYCVCSWHTHEHTRRRKWGVHLQLEDERERGEKGKRQECRGEHVLRMRAQKPNKSGHKYECNHTIEYTTFLLFNL